MNLLKPLLQYLLSIPLILCGRVEDPFVAGMAAEEEDADG